MTETISVPLGFVLVFGLGGLGRARPRCRRGVRSHSRDAPRGRDEHGAALRS